MLNDRMQFKYFIFEIILQTTVTSYVDILSYAYLLIASLCEVLTNVSNKKLRRNY